MTSFMKEHVLSSKEVVIKRAQIKDAKERLFFYSLKPQDTHLREASLPPLAAASAKR